LKGLVKMKKYAVYSVFLVIFLCSPAVAAIETVSFTSDNMRYDLQAGLFYAEGNVTIKGNDLTIIATHANGDINGRTFNLSGNITINGMWNGDNVNLSAMSATAEFREQPIYTLESGISGTVGKVTVDCDFLKMDGDNLFAKIVHRLKDGKSGVTFSADNITGKIKEGELTQAEANGNIIILGSPNKSSGTVELRGKKAVYSIERGTIVVSGGVSAKQNRRTLNADSIVYIPSANRIEAQGGRPRITVDIDDERLPSTLPDNNESQN
jgi:lipopolysaccharide export system protein LptA